MCLIQFASIFQTEYSVLKVSVASQDTHLPNLKEFGKFLLKGLYRVIQNEDGDAFFESP